MKKILKSKDFQVWFGMIIGSIIYSFGIVFVLDLGQFYASGVTGTAQIITSILQNTLNNGNTLVGVKSAFIIGINLPLFLIGWRRRHCQIDGADQIVERVDQRSIKIEK